MPFRLSTSWRNAALDAGVDLIDVGGGGFIQHRTGAVPTNVGDSDTGTLLGTTNFGATAFGAAGSGTVTANAITNDSSADATGTVAHVRIKRNDGTVLADADAAQGSGTFNFDNTSIVAGGVIAVSSFSITQPIS